MDPLDRPVPPTGSRLGRGCDLEAAIWLAERSEAQSAEPIVERHDDDAVRGTAMVGQHGCTHRRDWQRDVHSDPDGAVDGRTE